MIIPKSMCAEMLMRIHASHIGAEGCIRKAKDVLYWPNMSAEIKDYVSKCDICNEFMANQQKEPMLSTQVPELPWNKVAMDLFTLNRKKLSNCSGLLF